MNETRSILTIFTEQLQGKEFVEKELNQLCDRTFLVDGYLYAPKKGCLGEVLVLLRENNIQYYQGIQLRNPE